MQCKRNRQGLKQKVYETEGRNNEKILFWPEVTNVRRVRVVPEVVKV